MTQYNYCLKNLQLKYLKFNSWPLKRVTWEECSFNFDLKWIFAITVCSQPSLQTLKGISVLHHNTMAANQHNIMAKLWVLFPSCTILKGQIRIKFRIFNSRVMLLWYHPLDNSTDFSHLCNHSLCMYKASSRLPVPSQELPFQHCTHLLVYNNRLFQSHPVLQWKKIQSQWLFNWLKKSCKYGKFQK